MCNCDPLPHDAEMCAASKRIRSWLRADMERRIVRVDLSNKKPKKLKANAPVLNQPWLQKESYEYTGNRTR